MEIIGKNEFLMPFIVGQKDNLCKKLLEVIIVYNIKKKASI